jgi:hypothetical protein
MLQLGRRGPEAGDGSQDPGPSLAANPRCSRRAECPARATGAAPAHGGGTDRAPWRAAAPGRVSDGSRVEGIGRVAGCGLGISESFRKLGSCCRVAAGSGRSFPGRPPLAHGGGRRPARRSGARDAGADSAPRALPGAGRRRLAGEGGDCPRTRSLGTREAAAGPPLEPDAGS